MQPPTANDKQNTAYFISELYKDKCAAEKFKAANKRYKDKECIKEQSFYNNNSIII